MTRVHAIATENEGPLHAALKTWVAEEGDAFEVPLGGRQIDVVRERPQGPLLIEVQTKTLSAMRKKLVALLEEFDVELVHPVVLQKWLVKVDVGGERSRRRKSPFRGQLVDAFDELVHLRGLLAHPRLALRLLGTHEVETRRHEPGRVWRRKGWVIVERELVEVVDDVRVEHPDDLLAFLPTSLPSAFTTADLAESLQVPRDLAQKMAYTLRESNAVRQVGKQGNSKVYAVTAAPTR